jgi:hypothetical protein
MWKKGKRKEIEMPGWGLLSLVLAVIALVAALSVASWTWRIVDEQVQLREEIKDLRGAQEQVYIQYEFWLNQLQKEREALK